VPLRSSDLAQCETTLGRESVSFRRYDYLDKIVQYDLTLPAVDSETFRLKLRESFQIILNDTKNSREEWLERWDLHYNAYGAVFFTTIPVNFRTLRQHFHRYAQTTILPEERRMFEDAAWCMERACEDAACRKRIYKLLPQLEQH
jgi:hypothetical protein